MNKVLLALLIVGLVGCGGETNVAQPSLPKVYLPDSLQKLYFRGVDSIYSIGDTMFVFKDGLCDTIQIINDSTLEVGGDVQFIDTTYDTIPITRLPKYTTETGFISFDSYTEFANYCDSFFAKRQKQNK